MKTTKTKLIVKENPFIPKKFSFVMIDEVEENAERLANEANAQSGRKASTVHKTHGGPRKGAGRPKGAKSKNAKGRQAVTRSVSMGEESWARLDLQRGNTSRGKYIEGLIS